MEVSGMMTGQVCTISSDKSVSNAANRMHECGTDWLIVVDHGKLMGVVTSRQIMAAHPNRIVADAMKGQPGRIRPDQNVWEAHSIFHEHDDEVLLVMNEQELVGIVSRDAVQLKIAEYMDPLTGLYRAPFIEYVGEKWLKEQQPFHLLFIDINDFGKINKTYGHPFGDDVIRWYARVLTNMIQDQTDQLCRYAGDEFIVLTTAGDERVRQYVDVMEKPAEIGQVQISAAVGHLDGYREPNFFAQPLRELIAQASLLSTSAKMR
ncbi:diguanylate cyclase domain-containing protein [Brevibacillus sp. GCM10020057]|uniref:diguanylate cyclase domain-containing protein n=1 Tax=Brevibacillus sp. GCM10020057 TaxID=3317327 RepID=UPI00362A522E